MMHPPEQDNISETGQLGSTGDSETCAGEVSSEKPAAELGQKRDPGTIHDEIILMIRTVYDPEIPVNVYDLGLIYNVDVAENGHVDIQMTLTAPNCPSAEEIPAEVQRKALSVDGVVDVDLDLVWEPPWTKEMMSDVARLELGF
jgi:FeS assembly SUF system protein